MEEHIPFHYHYWSNDQIMCNVYTINAPTSAKIA